MALLSAGQSNLAEFFDYVTKVSDQGGCGHSILYLDFSKLFATFSHNNPIKSCMSWVVSGYADS